MDEKKSPLFALLDQLKEENNSHSQGVKRVFVKNGDNASALTQFAYGRMRKGDESGFHSHATMDEYFYFIKGKGLFSIEEENVGTVPASFIRVAAGARHNLKNEDEEDLEFVYFGIAL